MEKTEQPCCGGKKEKEEVSCSCGGTQKEIVKYTPVYGARKIAIGPASFTHVPAAPRLGEMTRDILARFGFGRMQYAVEPGLYAAGNPGRDSVVLVSANYKMSFNALRKELKGVSAWILVLDTKGVNVWCAAGKGTFGTSELVNRIAKTSLASIVSHRNIIVPQLGAPGVAAHEVMKGSKFRVIFGPVEARDIKQFLSGGMKASREQRTVRFGAVKRLEVSLLEFAVTFRVLFFAAIAAIVAASFTKSGFSPATGLANSAFFLGAMATALVSSTLAPALLLPYIPEKMFSVKGAITGAVFSAAFVAAAHGMASLTGISIILLSTAFGSFVFMNFTGSSTFTSLTGVRREIALSVPFQILLLLAGVALQIMDFVHKGAIKWN